MKSTVNFFDDESSIEESQLETERAGDDLNTNYVFIYQYNRCHDENDPNSF